MSDPTDLQPPASTAPMPAVDHGAAAAPLPTRAGVRADARVARRVAFWRDVALTTVILTPPATLAWLVIGR